MTNTPKNFGIQIEEIKLHDKEKIDDFKKLIKVLQDDNYKLEEERAKLKHTIKLQSMMYKTSDPSERFKNLTDDMLERLDAYAVRLVTGDAVEPADFYKLKEDNRRLEAQLEVLNSAGIVNAQQQYKRIYGDGDQSRDDGIQGTQLTKLLADNEDLRKMVKQLIDTGVNVNRGGTFTPGAQINYGNLRPPQPYPAFEGVFSKGQSFKFKSDMDVIDN